MDCKRRVYFNEYNVLLKHAAYLPFASGLLCAYAKSCKPLAQSYDFMPFLFLRKDVEKILSLYSSCDVAAFSISMWNEQYSLEVARRVKEKFPQCLVVFGGPQVQHDSREYFGLYPFIDVSVRGDGESSFAQILKRFLASRDFSGIPNISWRDQYSGAFLINQTCLPEGDDLDAFSSPYLMGLFDYLLKDSDLDFQAIIETNRGCPFSCAYCVWGKGGLNKKLRYHSIQRVADEIDWCGANKIRYLFNADANFGINKRDIEIAKILAKTNEKYGYPEKFRTCFTKNSDSTVYELAKLLVNKNLQKGVTLSFQSVCKEALTSVSRQNIEISVYRNLLDKFNQENISVYTELILGLPGETLDSFKNGIEDILEQGLRGQMFIYLCEVYPNTELADRDYQRKFGITTKKIVLTETHGLARENSGVKEFQEIVIGTHAMPLNDWRKMLIFSWVTMLLFSLKAGFFVLLYLYRRHGIKFIDFISFICESKIPSSCTMIHNELDIYRAHIEKILGGEGRCQALPDFGDIYWDMDEASFLRISNDFELFYVQMGDLVESFLQSKGVSFSRDELSQVLLYQLMRMPRHSSKSPLTREFSFNIPEFFQEAHGVSAYLSEKNAQKAVVYPKDYFSQRAEFASDVLLWGRKSNMILVPIKWTSIEVAANEMHG